MMDGSKPKNTLSPHTIPFGPRVDLMRSPIAMAPTNDDCTKETNNIKPSVYNTTEGRLEHSPPCNWCNVRSSGELIFYTEHLYSCLSVMCVCVCVDDSRPSPVSLSLLAPLLLLSEISALAVATPWLTQHTLLSTKLKQGVFIDHVGNRTVTRDHAATIMAHAQSIDQQCGWKLPFLLQ